MRFAQELLYPKQTYMRLVQFLEHPQYCCPQLYALTKGSLSSPLQNKHEPLEDRFYFLVHMGTLSRDSVA